MSFISKSCFQEQSEAFKLALSDQELRHDSVQKEGDVSSRIYLYHNLFSTAIPILMNCEPTVVVSLSRQSKPKFQNVAPEMRQELLYNIGTVYFRSIKTRF